MRNPFALVLAVGAILAIVGISLGLAFAITAKVANLNDNLNEPTRVEVDGGPVTPDQYDGVVRLAPTEYCFNTAEWISLNEGEVFCED